MTTPWKGTSWSSTRNIRPPPSRQKHLRQLGGEAPARDVGGESGKPAAQRKRQAEVAAKRRSSCRHGPTNGDTGLSHGNFSDATERRVGYERCTARRGLPPSNTTHISAARVTPVAEPVLLHPSPSTNPASIEPVPVDERVTAEVGEG